MRSGSEAGLSQHHFTPGAGQERGQGSVQASSLTAVPGKELPQKHGEVGAQSSLECLWMEYKDFPSLEIQTALPGG